VRARRQRAHAATESPPKSKWRQVSGQTKAMCQLDTNLTARARREVEDQAAEHAQMTPHAISTAQVDYGMCVDEVSS
jgi:hypothetical protein